MISERASGKESTVEVKVRLKPIALPAEHGSWGLVLEPAVLGLLVAPSWAGVLMFVGVLGAFLTRRPAKVIQVEWGRSGSRRAAIAWSFAVAYGTAAAAAIAGAIVLAGPWPMVPLIGAGPLLAVFLVYDFTKRGRSWQAETAGAAAFASVAASVAMTAGWPLGASLALSAVIVARAVPSVLYVRARLRLDRAKPRNVPLVIGAHALGLSWMVVMAVFRMLPGLVVAAFVVLLVRAALGLSDFRRRVPVNTIGFMEVGFGLLTILSVAVGIW